MNFKILICVFLLVAAFSPAVRADYNPLHRIYDSMRGLDVERFYDDYGSIIDFTIYLLFFLGAAKVTLGRHFQGRGGKAIIIAMALVLSISLAVTEAMMGFNIKSFGPVAALIFIGIIMVVLFLMLRSLHLSTIPAAAISYVLVYLSMLAISPSVFEWIDARVPLLGLILALGVLASLVVCLVWAWRRVSRSVHKPGVSTSRPDATSTVSVLKDERAEMKFATDQLDRLKKLTKIGLGDISHLIRLLEDFKRLISMKGRSEKETTRLTKDLEAIKGLDTAFRNRIADIRETQEKMHTLDATLLAQTKQRYPRSSGAERRVVGDEMRTQLRKLRKENELKHIEDKALEALDCFNDLLRSCIYQLNRNAKVEAVTVLDEAIKAVKRIKIQFKQLRHFEKKLQKLTKHGVTDLKKEKRRLKAA